MTLINQSVEELITEIAMSADHKPWLIVEGDTDCLFYEGLASHHNSKFVAAGGWENVVTVISHAIHELKKDQVFGVIDQDYREALAVTHNQKGIAIEYSSIFETDNADLENMLFHFDLTAKKVILSLRSATKLPQYTDVLPPIISLTTSLAKLRFYCQRNGLQIRLSGLDHNKFIDPSSMQIDSQKLINHINGKNPNQANLNHNRWEQAQQAELPPVLQDAKRLCNGHDLMAIFGIAFRKQFGSQAAKDVEPAKIEQYFRLACSLAEFQTTKLYASLAGAGLI